jgi:hypothetical protein
MTPAMKRMEAITHFNRTKPEDRKTLFLVRDKEGRLRSVRAKDELDALGFAIVHISAYCELDK